MDLTKEVAPGVAYLTNMVANVYFVGQPGEPWTLVDAGLPGSMPQILAAAAQRYGDHSKPASIVLTHGHFDHIGSARMLADMWDVLIYAHHLELPFVTGRASYPPFDPSVGGFLPFFSRFFPNTGADLGERVRELPTEGHLNEMPGWQWHFTPGHAPGHVSLFRPEDGALIAGDAFTTMNMDSIRDTMTKRPQICAPPEYATYDWNAARQSVEQLAELRPSTLATGHGVPLSGPDVADQLSGFARNFPIPARGRYVQQLAHIDEDGTVTLPPPVPNAFPKVAAGIGITALAGIALTMAYGRYAQSKRP